MACTQPTNSHEEGPSAPERRRTQTRSARKRAHDRVDASPTETQQPADKAPALSQNSTFVEPLSSIPARHKGVSANRSDTITISEDGAELSEGQSSAATSSRHNVPNASHQLPPNVASTVMSRGTGVATEAGDRSRQRKLPNPSASESTLRKSRFNTLPQEVDSALWVLHCELESVPLLRQKVSGLETEISRLHQEVNIQRNEIALTRQIGERARALEAELHKLKAEAAATDETEILKARNQELELKVAHMHSQLEVSTKTLQEWKQKLSNMIEG
ncbi:hypothetical protein BBP40_000271 [Aspergillus hancockii]|nr:hypothetical protein BBP40_000271 [Aspergillus hancockii]